MTQWVLKQNGEIVPRRTMRSLTPEELSRDSEILKRSNFTEAIKLKYGDSLSLSKRTLRVKFKEDEDDEYFDLPFDEVAPLIPEADIVGSASPKRAKSRRSGNIGLQKLIHGSNERYLYPDEKLAWYQT